MKLRGVLQTPGLIPSVDSPRFKKKKEANLWTANRKIASNAPGASLGHELELELAEHRARMV